VWDFSNIPSQNGYGHPAELARPVDGVDTSGLWLGAGVWNTGVTMAHAWGGHRFDVSEADAYSQDVAFYFDVIIAPGLIVTFDSIQTPLYGSPTQSPEKGQWQYSLNGGAWENIGDEQSPLPHGVYDWLSLDLTGVTDLKEVSNATVTFRLVLWGGTGGSNGRFYFGKGTASPIDPTFAGMPNTLTVNGTIVPEPSAAALLALSGIALLLRRRKRA